MAKILMAYAYTTSVCDDGLALNRPDAFKLDQNTPILLDHPDMTNSARVNKGVILSASYDKLGCRVEVLVFDDDLALSCKGLSIAAPKKAYMSNKAGMTPIELSLCNAVGPGNGDCKILASRDATPAEITFAKLGDQVRTLSMVRDVAEEITEMLAR